MEKDKIVTPGVAKEVNHAIEKGIPVFEATEKGIMEFKEKVLEEDIPSPGESQLYYILGTILFETGFNVLKSKLYGGENMDFPERLAIENFEKGDSPYCPYCLMEGKKRMHVCWIHKYVYEKWWIGYKKAMSL